MSIFIRKIKVKIEDKTFELLEKFKNMYIESL